MNELLMDRELLMEFVVESREHFDAVEDDLLALESDPDHVALEILDRIFRAVHTVKGSAGFLGLAEISRLSHVMETALARMRKGQLKPDGIWVEELLGGIDDLRALLNAACGGEARVDAGRVDRLEHLLEDGVVKTKAVEPSAPIIATPWDDVPKEFTRRLRLHWPDLLRWQESGGLSPLTLFSRLEKIGYVADASLRSSAERLSEVDERTALSLDVLFATAFSDEQVMAAAALGPGQLTVESGDAALAQGPAVTKASRSIYFRPSTDVLNTPGALDALWRDLEKLGPVQRTERGGAESGWDIRIFTEAPEDVLRDAFIFVEQGSEIRFEDCVPRCDRLEASVPVSGETGSGDGGREGGREHEDGGREQADKQNGPRPVSESSASVHDGSSSPSSSSAPVSSVSAADTLRVSSDKLDRLVNLVGEMVIVQAQLTAAASAAEQVPELSGAVESMQRLGSELRDVVLNIRMMPIGNLFGKYRRVVRDLSAELGKEVDLQIAGAETELDKSVIDQLGDPLVHLVRNSLDHGIETPEKREQSGKPRRGVLTLSAEQQGERVLITVRDDGYGLNTVAIRAKAEAQGLIERDARVTDAEIHQLIFRPGFSTAERVTSVSGRGVGMDVVKRRIDLLRGQIEIRSEPGRGSSFTLSLPLTLAIIEGLMVEVDGERFIVPLSMVTETIELKREQRAESNRRNLVAVRGTLVPYLRLRDVFGFPDHEGEVERVVITEVEDHRIGLVVDRVIGNHQTVLKSLGRLCRDVNMFSGGTILGDGAVALVLDISGILRAGRESKTECGAFEV